MSYEILEQKIKTIPSEYLEEFGVYVDKFLSNIQKGTAPKDSEPIKSLEALLSVPKRIPNGTDYKKVYTDYLESKYGCVG